MTTQTTSPQTPAKEPAGSTAGLIGIPPNIGRALATGGGILTIISTFLAWTWTAAFPGDLTVYGYPGGLQVLVLIGGALTTLFGLSSYGIKGLRWLTPAGADSAIKLAALAAFATAWYTIIAISTKLGGLANLEPGGWIVAIATLTALVGSLSLPFQRPAPDPFDPDDTAWEQFRHERRSNVTVIKAAFASGTTKAPAHKLPAYAEILVIVAALALGLTVFTYGIGTEYDEQFIGFLITAGLGFAAAAKAGLVNRLSALTSKHRNVTMIGAFVAAAAFPFTQSDDQYATIGVYILIFATVALGLNIVVGLAGLLDLGYVAFLGVGAYTAAMVSGSPSSPFDIHLPFWASALLGAAVAMVFGVLIGAPTLRLRGDYLAIVTLGFGEIFRITVLNMDGTSGPDITNGSNGISSIPNLNILGFDFGQEHSIAGFTIARFANYFLLMLLITLVVVVVFRRSGDSRIGRAWVAIREDETAALAMGINGFRVKLIAFALGAALAGLAGSVQAHVTYTVTPEQYQFAHVVPPNSAFLLAAVVLGGMGTISGPLVGAALLYLIPAKLQFLGDYQLLAFGLALVLLMRFRPEGLIPNRRRQLEFHEEAEAPTVLSKAGA
ncbi:branched-chain amino acid ABC transporter permease [Streptomyces phaeochromogenes]|uniref:Branched-chain amino acid ABC transporter permease n=1 Tax=Streptomyces phaeochromogenes TaxID=1923 RepID=A0ABZ1HMQ9_STRPH|nr:branched-chain amino acid ABC transporter permease [Streptomyces phaeochromogenes]MCX5597552.1 branched-chain amino acid ABC transporter permease [Streptomyces phaeochromogenes]WRZ33020.1 branched-chain amino acid ABC transporter permease [Streptomyces phaeochromogenes]WSD18505.1 branched-chain amino acid ABC transporter permease [Streptomyces phaeochromogenes]WSJ04684.1 branched-chain amino acid ABC transporter permease [Streptomyces phaeochromogenes]WSS96968.1 branched-chain amino acid AB